MERACLEKSSRFARAVVLASCGVVISLLPAGARAVDGPAAGGGSVAAEVREAESAVAPAEAGAAAPEGAEAGEATGPGTERAPGSASAEEPAPPQDSDEAILFQEIPSVYGVSRFEQRITEAPSFVTLVTAEEISKHGYRTLAEALRSVTGFFVTYDRNYNYLGIRGFNRPGDFNTRVLLLVDGHRLNDNLYNQAGLGTESLIDLDLVDRIELIRGPSSSLYGTNAFLGVINVITKRGRDVRGTELSAEIGSYGTGRARATYGDKYANGVELFVSGSFYDSRGQESLYYPEFDDPATNNGITNNADDDRFPIFFGKLSVRDLTLEGGFVSREKGIPTASYGTFFPTDKTRSTDEHGYAFLKYERQLNPALNVFGRIYYDRFYYQGDYLYDVSGDRPPDLVLNRDRSTGEWLGMEAKVDRRIFESHKVSAGIEYRNDFRQDLWNADLDPKSVYLDDRRASWNVAAFLQDEFSIREGLILNAGVRYDYYDSFGSTVNPRIALLYSVRKTSFKALYGTAFRGPNHYERFYVGTGFKANADLDPETIKTYELVVEHALTPYVRATASGYYYRIDDLISQEIDASDDLLVFRNRDEIGAKGIEFQLEMDDRGPLGIAGRVGYALQQAKDRRTNLRLTNSPAHLVNVNVTAPVVRDKLFGGLELLYASERRTLAGGTTDSHAVVNATLFTRKLVRGLEVSASVRNLFDKRYFDPGSGEQVQDRIQQDGRTFWLKLKYGF
jgi:outer membrane receptor for ferrienterochelin and colicins